MAAPIQSIRSLHDLLDHTGDDRLGVVALDLDYTLIKPPLIARNIMDWFLEENNERFGFALDSHYEWFQHMQLHLPFVPCETAHGVAKLIESFEEKGWHVCVLTARPESWKKETWSHIKSAGLFFNENDLILCGRRVTKDIGLRDWIHEQPALRGRAFRVLFADDQTEQCACVANITTLIEGVQAACFNYRRATHVSFTENDKRIAVMQLAARIDQCELPLERDYSDDEVQVAMEKLGIASLESEEFHKGIRTVAKAEGFPFVSIL